MSISENSLEKIQKDCIKPRSKLGYTIRESLLKLSIPILIFLAILLTSIIIITIAEIDYDIYRYMNIGFGEFVLSAMPYLAIFILAAVCFIAIKLYRSTEMGYKVDRTKLIFIGSTVILFGSSTIFISKISNNINDFIESAPELTHVFKPNKMSVWTNPDKGLLAGKVREINELYMIELTDLNSNQWLVNVDQLSSPQIRLIQRGNVYKFIGRVEGNNMFVAIDYRPWTLDR